jgi:hypothetical protein
MEASKKQSALSFKESMKNKLLFTVLLSLSFIGVAQQNQATKPPIPLLLGSNQIFEKSNFCKKYKCIPMPKQNGADFILDLPGEPTWATLKKDYPKKGNIELWQDEKTTLSADMDAKTKEISRISIELRKEFTSNFGTYPPETLVIQDLIYQAVGKKYPITGGGPGPVADDISMCFSAVRFTPEENISRNERLLFKGTVMLQVKKKKVPFIATCSVPYGYSKEKMYQPWFTIEIPSITETQNVRN